MKQTVYIYPLVNKSGSQLGEVILTVKQEFIAITESGNYTFRWSVPGDVQTFILRNNENVLARKMFNGLPYQSQTREMREFCQTFAEEVLPALKESIKACLGFENSSIDRKAESC